MKTLTDLIKRKDEWYQAELTYVMLSEDGETYSDKEETSIVTSSDNFFDITKEDNSLSISVGSGFTQGYIDLSKFILTPIPKIKVTKIEVIQEMDEDAKKQIELESKHLTLGELKSKWKEWNYAIIVYKQKNFTSPYTVAERSYLVSSSDKFFDDNMGGNGLFGQCLGDLDRCKLNSYDWEVDYCYLTSVAK